MTHILYFRLFFFNVPLQLLDQPIQFVPVLPVFWLDCASGQVEGGGAKKHRRLPSGRLQRQNSPSGDGWASLKGTAS